MGVADEEGVTNGRFSILTVADQFGKAPRVSRTGATGAAPGLNQVHDNYQRNESNAGGCDDFAGTV
ncbi:MAG: hypothetical protein ACKOEO_03140, partial [Planctomycetaceae bacterium]